MSAARQVIVITGPTATGKTALGVRLCRAVDGEVVSADSMQIYRGMDIGTAKATPAEALGVPHHMIDVADPSEPFSVSRYVELASACVEDIFSRGKTPVVVGGTGLYIDSLLSGRSFAENGCGDVRKRLSDEYDRAGGAAFLERLRAVDPERAAKLSPADRRRLVRAMEIFELTGRTATEHDEETKRLPPRWPSLRFALNFSDREALYRRIDLRVDRMFSAGLLGEVRALLADGLSDGCTAMQAIGYKEAAACLRGEIGEAEAAELIKLASRRYAKRQLTWLRRDPGLEWLVWDGEPDAERGAERILTKLCRAEATIFDANHP